MCGISGILAFENSSHKVTSEEIKKMTTEMIHRGPDAEGVWINETGDVGFGHRRLSIIDTSDMANQPMQNHDQTISLVFNGEIYNHLQIRQELKALGYSFKTDHSDTEVIIHAFSAWGIKMIDKLRGMFAIALMDNVNKELWLIRDRIGIKPLYWTIDNHRLYFASEIKAILGHQHIKREVNEDSLFHYLSFLTSAAPNTLFKDIYKLPGGHWMRVDMHGNTQSMCYWDALKNAQDLANENEATILKNIRTTLQESVELRQISDVPVGVFLSGGIDSSVNTALFSKNSDKSVKTFSIGYDAEYDSYKSELHYARMMAKAVNSKHHETLLNVNDLIDFLPKMIELQDEPIADPVCVPLYYVAKSARDNDVVVCQVGEGADELFMGYPNWKRAWILQKISDYIPVFSFVKEIGLWGLRKKKKHHTQAYDWLSRSADKKPIFWGGAEGFSHLAKMNILSSTMKEKYKNRSSWEVIEPIYKQYCKFAKRKSTLHWMTYLDLNFRLPELLLMRVDKMTMGNSLEGRVPFLDHKFVELAMGISEEQKTKNGVLKYALKKAVRGIIPDSIIDRPKQGFGVPVTEWLMQGVREYAIDAVKDFLHHTDYLDEQETLKLIRDPKSAMNAWYILNLALWWQHWIKDKAVKP